MSFGSDPTAVSSFIATFKNACNLNRVLELNAVWCLQSYVESQARSLLLIRLTGISMAVHFRLPERLRTHGNVVSSLLQTYATDEVIAKAYSDVVDFGQSSAITEKINSRMLWSKALRCQTVFSDRRLEPLFIEGLLHGTLAHTLQFFSFNFGSRYSTVNQSAQALGDSV